MIQNVISFTQKFSLKREQFCTFCSLYDTRIFFFVSLASWSLLNETWKMILILPVESDHVGVRWEEIEMEVKDQLKSKLS